MQYPTVTEKHVERETVAHDTFIDGLDAPSAPEPAPPRAAAHHGRRRRRVAAPAVSPARG